MNDDNWYVTTDGETTVGPVTAEQIRRGLEAGKIPLTASANRVGTTDWVPIDAVSLGSAASGGGQHEGPAGSAATGSPASSGTTGVEVQRPAAPHCGGAPPAAITARRRNNKIVAIVAVSIYLVGGVAAGLWYLNAKREESAAEARIAEARADEERRKANEEIARRAAEAERAAKLEAACAKAIPVVAAGGSLPPGLFDGLTEGIAVTRMAGRLVVPPDLAFTPTTVPCASAMWPAFVKAVASSPAAFAGLELDTAISDELASSLSKPRGDKQPLSETVSGVFTSRVDRLVATATSKATQSNDLEGASRLCDLKKKWGYEFSPACAAVTARRNALAASERSRGSVAATQTDKRGFVRCVASCNKTRPSDERAADNAYAAACRDECGADANGECLAQCMGKRRSAVDACHKKCVDSFPGVDVEP